MQQTLLALLGLLIVTMLSFNQQRASMQNQHQAIQNEYSQMALGVARQVMTVVQAQGFGGRSGNAGSLDCLDDWDALGDCEKIRDFNDKNGVLIARLPPSQQPDPPFRFQVEVEVQPATLDDDGNVDADETVNWGNADYKEITVRVQDCQEWDSSDDDPCEEGSFLTQPVVFTEIAGDTE